MFEFPQAIMIAKNRSELIDADYLRRKLILARKFDIFGCEIFKSLSIKRVASEERNIMRTHSTK